jgi:hypothetical protein
MIFRIAAEFERSQMVIFTISQACVRVGIFMYLLCNSLADGIGIKCLAARYRPQAVQFVKADGWSRRANFAL